MTRTIKSSWFCFHTYSSTFSVCLSFYFHEKIVKIIISRFVSVGVIPLSLTRASLIILRWARLKPTLTIKFLANFSTHILFTAFFYLFPPSLPIFPFFPRPSSFISSFRTYSCSESSRFENRNPVSIIMTQVYTLLHTTIYTNEVILTHL